MRVLVSSSEGGTAEEGWRALGPTTDRLKWIRCSLQRQVVPVLSAVSLPSRPAPAIFPRLDHKSTKTSLTPSSSLAMSASLVTPAAAAESLATTIRSLQQLLEAPADALTSAELSLLLSSLSLPHLPHSISLAILARALSQPDSPSIAPLQRALEERLSGSNSVELVEALNGLSALLQVAPSTGVAFFKDESLRSHLVESVESITGPKVGAGSARRDDEQRALVELLSLAAGQSGIRALVRKSTGTWLESLLGKGEARVRALAGVGVVKLRLGTESVEEGGAAPGAEEPAPKTKWGLDELMALFTGLLVEGAGATTEATVEDVVLPALEGLAYLTLLPSPSIKDSLCTDKTFLTSLFSLVTPPGVEESPPPAALTFAVASLIHNLVAYPTASPSPELSRLHAFANARPTPASTETKQSVEDRIALLLAHKPSPLNAIRILSKSNSASTRRYAGKIYHAIVTPNKNRPDLLKQGAAKDLMLLIRRLPSLTASASSTLKLSLEDIDPIQAIAKLLITTEPRLVLKIEALKDVVGSFALVMQMHRSQASDGSSEGTGVESLRVFECLMALTNIASADDTAEMVAGVVLMDGTSEISTKGSSMLVMTEELMLDSQTLVQRAATQLICNLITTSAGFTHYCTPSSPAQANDPTSLSARVHLLIALSSSADMPTRLAASGGLASLARAPQLAHSLVRNTKAMEIIMALLAPTEKGISAEDTFGLRARGWDILGSIANCAEGEEGKEIREGLRGRGATGKVRGFLKKETMGGGLKETAEQVTSMFEALSID